jgi:hypothetical protein
MAISVDLDASAISAAISLTTAGLTPRLPAPKASPDSFKITRRLRGMVAPYFPSQS